MRVWLNILTWEKTECCKKFHRREENSATQTERESERREKRAKKKEEKKERKEAISFTPLQITYVDSPLTQTTRNDDGDCTRSLAIGKNHFAKRIEPIHA